MPSVITQERKMKKHLLMAGAVVAALAIPLAANAQSGAATGAVGGAIVGGPVGAVVGGVGGAIIGGISDDTDTLDLALAASGCDQARVVHKPRLPSDNGSSYVSAELAQWLDAQAMGHVRGAPYHPQTHGKIERWHQTLKNRILLENYYLPGDLLNF
jgi:hypothetical protein